MRTGLRKFLYYTVSVLSLVFTSLTVLSIIGVLTMSYIPFGIVLTTSMMPKLPPGTLVFAVPVFDPLKQLHPGDIAIYCAQANFMGVKVCKPIIHRVIGVDPKHRIIYFKGDANPVVEIVKPSQVVSKVLFYIPSLYWVQIPGTHVGFYVPCGVLLFLLLLLAPRYVVVEVREV